MRDTDADRHPLDRSMRSEPQRRHNLALHLSPNYFSPPGETDSQREVLHPPAARQLRHWR